MQKKKKKIAVVILELDNPYDLNAEEIEEDIRKGEDQIGWNYDYKVVSVNVELI